MPKPFNTKTQKADEKKYSSRVVMTSILTLTILAALTVFINSGPAAMGEDQRPKNATFAKNYRLAASLPANQDPPPTPAVQTPVAAVKLEGCVSCHGQIEPMHKYGPTEALESLKDGKDGVGLTCTGCHGGNPVPGKNGDDSKQYESAKREAHVRARFPDEWERDGKYTGANPERSSNLILRESWEFVRFVNPGDIRVAARSCGGGGGCHDVEAKNVSVSMMAHGAMLWGAALYNLSLIHI